MWKIIFIRPKFHIEFLEDPEPPKYKRRRLKLRPCVYHSMWPGYRVYKFTSVVQGNKVKDVNSGYLSWRRRRTNSDGGVTGEGGRFVRTTCMSHPLFSVKNGGWSKRINFWDDPWLVSVWASFGRRHVSQYKLMTPHFTIRRGNEKSEQNKSWKRRWDGAEWESDPP